MVLKRKKKKEETPVEEQSATREGSSDFFYNLNELEQSDFVSDKVLPTDNSPDETAEDLGDTDDSTEAADFESVIDEPQNVASNFNMEPESSDEENEDWIEEEQQLSIDVFQDSSNIYIKAAVPGMEAEDIEITINNDMVTIRGQRRWHDEIDEDNYYFQECFWGTVSRSIILPVEIDEQNIDAVIKNGVLTVTLPKIKRQTPGTQIKVNSLD